MAVSGLGLLVVSFLPWYSVQGDNATAWQAFSVVDLVIAAAAIAGLSVGIAVLGRISVSYPVAAAGRRVRQAGAAADRLPPESIRRGDGVDREIGAWFQGWLPRPGSRTGYLGMQEQRPLRNPSAA